MIPTAHSEFQYGTTTGKGSGKGIQMELPINYGLLVGDNRGKVVLCNDLAAIMFSSDPGDVEGYSVRELLPDIVYGNNSDNYVKHYLSDLNSQLSWHCFRASDRYGLGFKLDASVSKFEVDSVPLFLLRLRHRENA